VKQKGAIHIGPQFAQLQRIDGDVPITKENHTEFLYLLQSALLLALQEKGILDRMEYRHAEEALRRQRRTGTSKISAKEAFE
jgi:hypothetical protein